MGIYDLVWWNRPSVCKEWFFERSNSMSGHTSIFNHTVIFHSWTNLTGDLAGTYHDHDRLSSPPVRMDMIDRHCYSTSVLVIPSWWLYWYKSSFQYREVWIPHWYKHEWRKYQLCQLTLTILVLWTTSQCYLFAYIEFRWWTRFECSLQL